MFELAVSEKFPCIIVKGDSKICIDALNCVSWCVSNLLFNILECRKSFSSCLFVWIRREANKLAHIMVKFASNPDRF